MDHIRLHHHMQLFIDSQYAAHEELGLGDFARRTHLFHRLNGDMVTFAAKNRRIVTVHLANPAYRESLVGHFLDGTARYTYRRNQFIRFPRPYVDILTAEYRDFLNRFGTSVARSGSPAQLAGTLNEVLALHLARLRAMLLSQTASMTGRCADNPFLRTVTCGEYSAGIQRNVLGIGGNLMEPVLDIGCGKGTLVAALRNEGVDAYGIDRCAPAGDGLTATDWFDFEFEPARWGTILAHQSLSTHFIFHHSHGTSEAERYVSLFMRVLGSLRDCGALYYAPGLPFFEPILESLGRYRVRRDPLPFDSSYIGDTAYATAITRSG